MIKITFLGDILCTKDMRIMAHSQQGYNFDEMFSPIVGFLSKSNYVIANLETPVSLSNTDLVNSPYSFNAPREFVQSLRKAGIHFVSTANNHCLDRGLNGIENTLKVLDAYGLAHTGTFSSKRDYSIVDINGLKLGILSYSYGTNAFANNVYLSYGDYKKVNLFQNQELSFFLDRYIITHPHQFIARLYRWFLRHFYPVNCNKEVYERQEFSLIRRLLLLCDIRKIKRLKPDYVIMLAHIGGQYNQAATKETITLCSYLLNHGVDLVIGNHEHVIHGIDTSQCGENKYVVYSLGNFLSPYGTIQSPNDVFAEYSIAWHIYVNDYSKVIEKVSFSILRNVFDEDNKMLKVYSVYDLYSRSNEQEFKNQLIHDIEHITRSFIGESYSNVQEEYTII